MHPSVASDIVVARRGMEGLLSGAHVAASVGAIGGAVDHWRAALAKLDGELEAAAQRRREAERRLESLRERPAPLLGSRDARAMAAEVARLEQELDATRRDEAEAQGLRPDVDLIAALRADAARIVAPALARVVAGAERRAATALQDMRHTAVAVLAILDEVAAARRQAEAVAGRSLEAPTMTLPGRAALERIASAGGVVVA